MEFETVQFSQDRTKLRMIDQTLLPHQRKIIELDAAEDIWDAIRTLKVRGAPAIGVAAAIGVSVLSKKIKTEDPVPFKKKLIEFIEYLKTSRPTAVNLFWALQRMERTLEEHQSIEAIRTALEEEAFAIREEDVLSCKRIGELGSALLKDQYRVLTHCNAGSLATSAYGTATAPIYRAVEEGLSITVYADETRPLLQGARLTAYELSQAGIDVTVLCDHMSGQLMRDQQVDIVFVGCDRVAANGDVANKIGTYMLALAAKRNHIPFYVCAPTSTIDMATSSGREIPIEMRDPKEVSTLWYRESMVPKGVDCYNPAFDITDHDLITGIITEKGILYPPYDEAFRRL